MVSQQGSNPLGERAPLGQTSESALGRRIAFYTAVVSAGIVLGLAVLKMDLLLLAGGLVALGSTLIILFRPYIGLLCYTILFVLRPGEVYPILAALHLERLVGTLTLVSMFLEQQRREKQILLDGSLQTRLLAFFVAAVALSVPFAIWRARAMEGLIEVLRIAAFYLMVAHLVDTQKRLRYFIWTFCLLIAFLAITSLKGYFDGGAFFAQGIERAVGSTSMGNNPNELGTTLASAVPVFLLTMAHPSPLWRRALLGVLSLVMLVVIALTGSRASLLGLIAGFACLWWMSRRRLLMGMLGLCLVVAGFFMLPEQYKERYSTITKTHDLDGSSRSRLVTWMAGVNMVIDRPLFGVGILCYGTANAMEYSSGPHRNWLEAHSLYFQILGELGLVGTIAFFSFLIEMLRLNRRTARELTKHPGWTFEVAVLNALLAGVIVLLVSGIFGHSLLRRTWYVYAATGLAILRIYLQREEMLAPAQGGSEAAQPGGRSP